MGEDCGNKKGLSILPKIPIVNSD